MIYYFNGELAVRAIVDEIRSGDALGFYCPITWVELLCYPGLSEIEANQIRQDTVGEPCSRFINRYAETSILRRAGAIYDIRAA